MRHKQAGHLDPDSWHKLDKLQTVSTLAMAESRALYRAFLRVGHSWQKEPSRVGRNIRDAILAQTKTLFRENLNISGEAKNKMLQHARMELEALRMLQANVAMREVF